MSSHVVSHRFLMLSSTLLMILHYVSAASQIEFLDLPQKNNGSLRQLFHDSRLNMYGSGFDPGVNESSGFVLKFNANMVLLWRIQLQTSSQNSPSIAFSESTGLFAVVLLRNETFNSSNILLHHIDINNGSLLQSMLVETGRFAETQSPRCSLSSNNQNQTMVYVSYIVQDIDKGYGETVVSRFDLITGKLVFGWRRLLTNLGRTAITFNLAEDKTRGHMVIVEANRRLRRRGIGDLDIYVLDQDANVVLTGSLKPSSPEASIADIVIDDLGVYYIAESPSLLHSVAISPVLDTIFLKQIWKTSVQVVSMCTSRNRATLYVIAKGKGFRNEEDSVIPTTTAVALVFNSTGHEIYREEYIESLPDVERQVFTMSLIQQSNEPVALLGGSLRSTERPSSPTQISVGRVAFPSPVSASPQPNQPEPDVSQIPSSETEDSGGFSLIVGMSVGVAIMFVGIIVALFIVIQRKRKTAKSRVVPKGDAANQTIKNDGVLV